MTELFDFDVTPSRLGEMYVNTIVNTTDLLLSHEYAMAAQARTAPAALLAPLPQMTRKRLLAFIDGATKQSERFLDSLGPDLSTDMTHDFGCAAASETATYAERVELCLTLIDDPATRGQGFTELGRCDHGIQGLISSPDLAHHTRKALQKVQERINAALDKAASPDLLHVIAGNRETQANCATRGLLRS